ncbi:MAG: patatin-like phospholipase family protein [Acidimicrobiales bacterium]
MQLARKGVAIHDNATSGAVEEVLPVGRFEGSPSLPVWPPHQRGDRDLAPTRARSVEPILASSALPAVYPPVEIDGVKYLDGAIVNDVPVSRAVALGADRIFVLHVGSWDRPPPSPSVRSTWRCTPTGWRAGRGWRDLASIPSSIEVLVLRPGPPR